jgi:hypothetical protein
MQPAFPAELGNELGPDVLMIWSFLHSFSNILGLCQASVDEVLTAIALGDRRLAQCYCIVFRRDDSPRIDGLAYLSLFMPTSCWACLLSSGGKVVVEDSNTLLAWPSTPRRQHA